MEPIVTKKDIFRKYAKILNVDDPNQTTKSTYPPIHSSPLKTNSQPDMLEKFIQLKQSKDSFLTPHMLPFPPSSLKNSISKAKNSTFANDTSINSTTAKALGASPSEKNFTGISYIDERNKDEIEGTPTKSVSRIEWSDAYGKLYETDKRDQSTLGNISMSRAKKAYNPYGEKDITLEDLYSEAREFSEELKAIVSQEHEQMARLLTKHLNVKEFIKIQKARINNVVKVTEKGFVHKLAKDNRILFETWNLVFSEINEIKATYDDFLFAFEDSLSQVNKGKKKIDDPMRAWDGIKMLMEYSPLYRLSTLKVDEGVQDKLSDLLRRIREFKVEYKLSREFKPQVYEIFEQMDAHLKELNQQIDTEKEKVASLSSQRDKLSQENKEFQEKNDQLKAQMLDAIQNWKKGVQRGPQQTMPAFQEKIMQEKIDELKAELGKVTDDNIQLRRDLREAKQEVKRLGVKEDRGVKASKDKEVMVDLYSKEVIVPISITMSSYLRTPDLYKDASSLPKELVGSMLSLIYSDKMVVDLCDDNERRPRKSLVKYLPEWFLMRFGSYTFSEALLRDFMLNLNSLANQDRCKVFKELLGVEMNSPADSFKYILSTSNQPDKLRMKKLVFSTSGMLKQFYKLIDSMKHSDQIKPDALQQDNYGPFLPDAGSSQELISNENAKALLKKIIREEKMSLEDARDIEYYLYLIQQNDKDSSGDGNSSEKYMKFDVLVKFMMEVYIVKHTSLLEKYYTTLKTRTNPLKQGGISYEEFAAGMHVLCPDATKAWKDHAFARLMEEYPPNRFPLLKMIESFVDSYFREDEACDLYQQEQMEKQRKKEASLAKIEKGSKVNINTKSIASPTNQASLIRANTIKTRLLQSTKEAFDLGETGLNENGYHLYDAISSLIVLQETYYMIEEKVTLAEKTTEGLAAAREDFDNTIGLLPKHYAKMGKLENLTVFGKEELVDYLEQLWTKLRCLIDLTFKYK